MHKADRHAHPPKPPRAPNPVQVRLRVRLPALVQRDIVIDHQTHRRHINPPREDVRGDEDLRLTGSEVVNDLIALGAVVGAVESGDFMAVGFHATLDFGGGFALLDEDDGRADGEDVVEFDEDSVFVFFVFAVHVQLFDAVDGEFLVLERDLVGVRGEAVGVLDYLVGEGGGEEDDLGG